MKLITLLFTIALLINYSAIFADDHDQFPDRVKAHLEGQLPK